MGDARPRVRRVGARRRAIAGLVLLAAAIWGAAPRAPSAQPDPRIPWIGYLANEPTTDSAPILRDGLREHEWIELRDARTVTERGLAAVSAARVDAR